MTAIRKNPLRRALRALNLFTLVSFNSPSAFRAPYAGPTSMSGQGHRMF